MAIPCGVRSRRRGGMWECDMFDEILTGQIHGERPFQRTLCSNPFSALLAAP